MLVLVWDENVHWAASAHGQDECAWVVSPGVDGGMA